MDFSPTIQSSFGDYIDLQNPTLISGELFSFENVNYDEQVVVVSDGFADAVSEETGLSVINKEITIN